MSFKTEKNKINNLYNNLKQQEHFNVLAKNVESQLTEKIFNSNQQKDSTFSILNSSFSSDWENPLVILETSEVPGFIVAVAHKFRVTIPELHENYIPFIQWEILAKALTSNETFELRGVPSLSRDEVLIIDDINNEESGFTFVGLGDTHNNPIKKVTLDCNIFLSNYGQSDAGSVPFYQFKLDMRLLPFMKVV